MAGHGKVEVDNVGGLAKCSICRYVGTGIKIINATDCKYFLRTKFAKKTNSKLFLKLIDVDYLADSRAEVRLKKHLTIDGSDSFQVMIFQSIPQPASHLCICDRCLIDYGPAPDFPHTNYKHKH